MSTFRNTVISAWANFINFLFKLLCIFNLSDVANMGKNMMNNVLKVSKVSPSSLAGADVLSKAKDVLPATDLMKQIPKDIPSKDAVSNAVSAASNAISSPLGSLGL
ncbi:uncharacterized protein LOC123670536 [Melitaea cinxia]|uniref:uncharacterized protein LOC123670536 n=1 Tax=Melitaea cinxia TaxID=113334 RepID=UPI001E271653|nr:uncharacterized protein LOC123670536 [Melitaea cinxia]